jgi:hypothetical protein
MTCLFNARAYRDGSAAAPLDGLTPHTGYWAVVGLYASTSCLVYRARGFRDGAPRVQGADGHRSSQRHRESANTFFLCPCGPWGWVLPPGPAVLPGSWGRVLAAPFGIQLAVAIAGLRGPGGEILWILPTFRCLDGRGQICCCMAWNDKKTIE